MTTDSVCALMDGGYIRAVCHDDRVRLDYNQFMQFVRNDSYTRHPVTAMFVDYIPPDRMNSPQFRALRKAGIITESCEIKSETKFDPLQQREFTARVQKGGDTLMAFYLTHWAHRQASHIYLMSGDGDFAPVLRILRMMFSLQITLLHFGEHTVSDALLPYVRSVNLYDVPGLVVGGATQFSPPRPLSTSEGAVTPASSRGADLYVRGIPTRLAQHGAVRALFDGFDVVSVFVYPPRRNRTSTGARVVLASADDAERAILHVSGSYLGDEVISVERYGKPEYSASQATASASSDDAAPDIALSDGSDMAPPPPQASPKYDDIFGFIGVPCGLGMPITRQ